MSNVLSLIVESRKKRIEILKTSKEAFLALITKAPQPISFKKVLKNPGKISLIGEIKQASPTSGILRQDFSPVEIAKMYERSKVAAISVLTEEEFFLGKINYIESIKKEVKIPVLRKDFIIDEIQILESRAVGADAIILIMRILSEEKFAKLYNMAKSLGMDVLVEVHSLKELHKVLKHGVDLVGINNRNLNTLKVELNCTEKLIPFIPADVIRVSESGVTTAKDMMLLKGLGVDAVLVGTSIMKASDMEGKIKELNIDFQYDKG